MDHRNAKYLIAQVFTFTFVNNELLHSMLQFIWDILFYFFCNKSSLNHVLLLGVTYIVSSYSTQSHSKYTVTYSQLLPSPQLN
jgi:hypothetical protein